MMVPASYTSKLMMEAHERSIATVLLLLFVLQLHPVICSKSISEIVNKNNTRVESLKSVNFLVGIADRAVKIGSESNQSRVLECARDMKLFLDAVESKQIWAIKLIDAFGNVPRSFIWGNNFWFSSQEICADIYDPYQISLSSSIPRASNTELTFSTSPYKMQLQMVYFSYSSSLQLDLKQQYQPYIEVGLCVPESCPKSAISIWSNEYFQNQSFSFQNMYDIHMSEVDAKVVGFRINIFANTGLILFMLLSVGICSLTILAEIVHILQKRCFEISKNNSKEEFLWGSRLIMCFSLRKNIPIILQTSAPKGFVPVIAGLKTLVCFWVTLLHIYYHSMFTRGNVQFLYAKLESFILQPILQACFYVDAFFAISGFLLAYNFLSNVQQIEKIKSNSLSDNLKLFLKLITHRHFRLMPMFILTMLLSDFFFVLIDMLSPFYMNEDNDLYCKETWWYNLLYINNAIPMNRMCASWGWYIACEMQFYILFLGILFVYVRSEKTGKTIFTTALCVFVSVSYYCYYSNGITFQIDVISTTIENVYIKPWTRISPYFGGMLMGWLLYQSKDSALKFSRMSVTCFWMLAVVIYFLTVFMSYWKDTPVWIVSGIMSLGKVLFGIFIGSLICVCQLGYGGIFNVIMGSKVFLYLNKFSYSMYMIAPIIITVLFGLRTEASQFNELSATSDIFAVIVISHCISFLASLFIELPFQKISNNFILRKM